MVLLGVALLLVGWIGTVGFGFQIWRTLGGSSSGKRLREMDTARAPAALRIGARVFGILVPIGVVVLGVGLIR